MKYYQLTHSTNSKEVGVFEQIQELIIPYTKDLIDWFGVLELSRKTFLDAMPPLNKFKLSDTAGLTDILSFKYFSTNIGFLLNKNVKQILDDCLIFNYKYYNAVIHLGNIKESFFLFHIIEGDSYIDFLNSEFYYTNFIGMKKDGPIEIKSFDDFNLKNHQMQIEKPGTLLSFTKVCLKDKVDVVRLPGNPRIYFSEDLKDKFEKNKVTGLTFNAAKCEFFVKD